MVVTTTTDQTSLQTGIEAMKESLLNAGYNWADVESTALGAMFQNAADPKRRRELGEHYTSEKDILKTLRPLILNELDKEFTKAKGNGAALERFHNKLAALKFFDPAAGCGNFLIIAYREMRRLEREVYEEKIRINGGRPGAGGNPKMLKGIHSGQGIMLLGDEQDIVRIRVENFYGIELEEFPAEITEVALYLEQHRQDQLLSNILGASILHLPLVSRAHIVKGNAATLNWSDIIPATDELIIIGNPPYIGARMMNPVQRMERDEVWSGVKRAGKLDYVTVWFMKAAGHIRGTQARVAFVSTNSVHQGEQVAPFWGTLRDMGMKINFAHRTFAWKNDAKGMASVHVVVVGFSWGGTGQLVTLFDYPDIHGEPVITHPATINAYLTGGPDIIVSPRSTPLSKDLTILHKGTEFTDGAAGWHGTEKYQGLLLDETGYWEVMADPVAAAYVRELTGADELIEGKNRWCLWLVGAGEETIRSSAVLTRRVSFVDNFRGSRYSPAPPALPVSVRHRGTGEYLAVPVHTTQLRDYFVSAFVSPDIVCTNSVAISFDATMFDFAVISSRHMRVWGGTVAGRIGSGIRFGGATTWNTYPLPDIPGQLRTEIEVLGRLVLDTRAKHPGSSLADLYGSEMPADLKEAHHQLDLAFDGIFGLPRGSSDVRRLGRLIDLYSVAVG